jgi:hypothetical protein
MDKIPPPPPFAAEAADPALIPSAAFLWRNRHWTMPLASIPFMAVAGDAAGAAGAHMDIGVGAGTATLAMWLAAPHKWDRRAEQWYARLTTTATAGWLYSASWAGLDWWTFGAGCAVCLSWGIPWWHHKRPRRKKAGARDIARWDEWWQHHCRSWGLAGSKIADVTVLGVTVTLTVQLWAGRQAAQSVTQALPYVESALRGLVGAGMIRCEPDRDNPSRVLLHLKRSDPLRGEVTWDASWLPESATGDWVMGVAESGRLVRGPVLVNSFTTGATRTGKSNEQSHELAAVTACPDAVAWMIDRKGGRAARPWLEALDWVATTTDEARLMLACAAAEVEARALHAYDGSEQLEPAPEVPAIVIFVDEAHEAFSLMRGDARCAADAAAIASMGSGVNVHLKIKTQYGALAESVRTEQIRSNLPLRMCFRTETAAHGTFALGDRSKADASRLRGKGSFYYKLGPDVPEEQARGAHMHHDLVRAIAARHGAMPRIPLRLYASDHQGIYDARWSRLPAPLRHLAPQWNGSEPEPAPAEAAGGEAWAAAMRIEDDIAATPDLAALPRVADFEVRDALARGRRAFADALERAPAGGIAPRRLIAASGMSRSWVMGRLKTLTGQGTVEKVQDGMYRAADGADVAAAMDEISAASARLLADAQSA